VAGYSGEHKAGKNLVIVGWDFEGGQSWGAVLGDFHTSGTHGRRVGGDEVQDLVACRPKGFELIARFRPERR
jgi:hypothetical protein